MNIQKDTNSYRRRDMAGTKDDRQVELERQIETILRLDNRNRHQVIVRMESPTEAKKSLIDVASDALRQRNMALSARECLPPAVNKQLPPMGRQSPVQRQMLYDKEKSLSGRVTPRNIKPTSTAELKAGGIQFLDRLIASDIVKKASAEEKKKSKKQHQRSVQDRTFWTSKSMLLDLSTQDLERLPAEVPGLRDVHLNRVLRNPQLVEVKTLPDVVLENKASSWGIEKIRALAT